MIPGVVMVLKLCRRMALFLEKHLKIFWDEISDVCKITSNFAEKII